MAWLDEEAAAASLPGELTELLQVSQICQAFGCTPSQALHELHVLPEGFMASLLTVRAYCRAHAEMSAALAQGEKTGEVCARIDLASEILTLSHERRTGVQVPR